MNIAQILINAEENERQRSYAEEEEDKSELLAPFPSPPSARVCVRGEFRRQYIPILHAEIHVCFFVVFFSVVPFKKREILAALRILPSIAGP